MKWDLNTLICCSMRRSDGYPEAEYSAAYSLCGKKSKYSLKGRAIRCSYDSSLLTDDEWLAKLSYLADVFTILNELNLSLQGPREDMFTLRDKMNAFRKKICMRQSLLNDDDFQTFPFNEFRMENDVNHLVLDVIRKHVNSLKESFDTCFPVNEDPRRGHEWIINPFKADVMDNQLSIDERSTLIYLSSDSSIALKFRETPCRSTFWLGLRAAYLVLSQKAMQILIQFSTTYLCEKTFSSMAPLRLGVASLQPQITKILSSVKEHGSH